MSESLDGLQYSADAVSRFALFNNLLRLKDISLVLKDIGFNLSPAQWEDDDRWNYRILRNISKVS